jgi:hypothetical protein
MTQDIDKAISLYRILKVVVQSAFSIRPMLAAEQFPLLMLCLVDEPDERGQVDGLIIHIV